jgi:hypothetical protein
MTDAKQTTAYGKERTFWDKTKEAPFVPLGILGTAGMIIYGTTHYKNRPKGQALSVYLMQYRVIAQSMIVGAMTLGVSYALIKDYLYPPKKEE